MKAITYEKFGPPEVLHLSDADKPIPGPQDVLIRVKYSSVNYGDLTARNFANISPGKFNMPFLLWVLTRAFFGLFAPRIRVLGSEYSGVVESVGNAVTRFSPGDSVFGYLGQTMGAYAEYLRVPETGVIVKKPNGITHREAAAIPMGAIMALYLLREKGRISKGTRVLINGASGAIGAAAVQIAKSMGAEVTGVCGSRRVPYVSALGADYVIDYSQEDFTRGFDTYDLIFDVLGKGSFIRAKRVLAEDGRYLYASFKFRQLFQMAWSALTRQRQRVICAIAPGSVDDLKRARELMEAGKLKAIVDKSFPMSQAASAHRYVEEGNRLGSVLIAIE